MTYSRYVDVLATMTKKEEKPMPKKRKRVLNKSKGLCWYCGQRLVGGWHVDHFHPIGREPNGIIKHPERDIEDNLVPACPSCNVMKSDMDIEQFRNLIANFIVRLNRDIPVYKHAKRYGLVGETDVKVVFWFERTSSK